MDIKTVNVALLKSIKNFVDDLSTLQTNKDFIDYKTIVNKIDESKVKSYHKLIDGFKLFFETNKDFLVENNFENLTDSKITYAELFSFDFKTLFLMAEESDQEIIKDHLNHIWKLLNSENQSPEELYINKVFEDLKSKFSPDLTRDDQMTIAKTLFNDFQKQNLDISIVVKVACQKAREQLLLSSETEDHSKTLVLIESVEEIDINNFSMIEFMKLVGKVGTLFADGDNNPLNGLLSNIFGDNGALAIQNSEI